MEIAHVRSTMDSTFAAMRDLETRIKDEVCVLNASTCKKVLEFDRSYQLLEPGKLNVFNNELRQLVDEVADKNAFKAAEFTNIDIDQVFVDTLVNRGYTQGEREIYPKVATETIFWNICSFLSRPPFSGF